MLPSRFSRQNATQLAPQLGPINYNPGSNLIERKANILRIHEQNKDIAMRIMNPRRPKHHFPDDRSLSPAQLDSQLKITQANEQTLRTELRKQYSRTRHFTSELAQENNLEMGNKILD